MSDPVWRDSMVMAGVRVLLRKALRKVGGYFTLKDTAEELAEQGRQKGAPVEEVVDEWVAAALAGTVMGDAGPRQITTREAELMREQAARTLEIFRREMRR